MTQRYHIILVSKKAEADTEKVVAAMMQLFKVSAEKAQKLLTKPTIIKKNVDRNTADKYQAKLASIGLNIVVKSVGTVHGGNGMALRQSSPRPSATVAAQAPTTEKAIKDVAGLSLATEVSATADEMPPKTTQDSVNFSLVPEDPSVMKTERKETMDGNEHLMLSPEENTTTNQAGNRLDGLSLVPEYAKANSDESQIDMNLSSELDLSGATESTNSNQIQPQTFVADDGLQVVEQSAVVVATDRVQLASNQTDLEATIEEDDYSTAVEPTNMFNRRLIDDITLLSIIVGVVTAICGALLWRVIAVSFSVEIAWVAMLIGGAIGFAVATSGGQGRSTGILCAVLATIAIMLGKYWAVQGMMSNVMNEFKTILEPEYVVMQEAANTYSTSMTDKEFISFLQEFGDTFSEYTDLPEEMEAMRYQLDEASPEVIAGIRVGLEPELDKISSTDFDTWYETEFLTQIESMQDEMGFTAGDLVKEDFDIIDVIFLLVGVFAAFKVGSGDD